MFAAISYTTIKHVEENKTDKEKKNQIISLSNS